MTTTITPAEIDSKIAQLALDAHRATYAITSARQDIHVAAGDTRSARGGWKMSLQDAKAAVEPTLLVKLIEAEAKAVIAFTLIKGQAEALDDIYLAHRWTRYYFCTSTNGHIHSAERACPTLRPTTQMAWHPELSGLTGAEVVEKVGPAMCSVCYPDAPVEHTSSNLTAEERRRTQPERDAAKAEREAIKAAKWLTTEQAQQIGRVDGDRIETVAACVEVLRQEVEFRDYFGRGEHPSHAAYVQGAALVKTVLIQRELAHAGHGKTVAEIETIIERAIKRNIKDGAREEVVRSF